MARHVEIQFTKTYATKANAERAVEKLLGKDHAKDFSSNLRYIIMPTEDGRFGVLFIGNSAMQAGIHFHFNCVN